MKKRLLGAAMAAVMMMNLGTISAIADEAVTLQFIDVSPSTQRQKYYETIFEEFEAETGIAVQYQSVLWDEAADYLTALGENGKLPDVLTLHSYWLGQFTEADWLLPLGDYVEENKDEFIDVVQMNWEAEKQKFGDYYTIPDGFMTKGIYYRKDWVNEIGYEIPTGADWTWTEYFNLIRALYDESQNRWGNAFRGGRGGFDVILSYLQTTTNGYTYDEKGNFLLNTPECVELLEEFCSVYTEGYVPKESINWGFGEQVENFTNGLVGTLYNDSEVIISCVENMDPDTWGVLPVPSSKDGIRINSSGSSYAYGVSTDSAYPQEALMLIDYLARSANNLEYCEMTGQMPVKKEAMESFAGGTDSVYSVFMEELNNPNLMLPASYGQFNYTDLHQEMFHVELQKYLSGKQKAEDVLDNIGIELTSRMQIYLAANEGASVEEPAVLADYLNQ